MIWSSVSCPQHEPSSEITGELPRVDPLLNRQLAVSVRALDEDLHLPNYGQLFVLTNGQLSATGSSNFTQVKV